MKLTTLVTADRLNYLSDQQWDQSYFLRVFFVDNKMSAVPRLVYMYRCAGVHVKCTCTAWSSTLIS